MIGGLGEDHCRPCRNRCLESGATGKRELAAAGRELVVVGISEMRDRTLQPVFSPRAAERDLRARDLFGRSGEIAMGNGIRPDLTSGSAANSFSSSRDMQRSPQTACSRKWPGEVQ